MKKYVIGLLLTGLVFVSGTTSAHAATLLDMQAQVSNILTQVQQLPNDTIAELQLKVSLLTGALSLQTQVNALIQKGGGQQPAVPVFISSLSPASGLVNSGAGTHITFSGSGFGANDQAQIQESNGSWGLAGVIDSRMGTTIGGGNYNYIGSQISNVPYDWAPIPESFTVGKTYQFRIMRKSDGAVSNPVSFEVSSTAQTPVTSTNTSVVQVYSAPNATLRGVYGSDVQIDWTNSSTLQSVTYEIYRKAGTSSFTEAEASMATQVCATNTTALCYVARNIPASTFSYRDASTRTPGVYQYGVMAHYTYMQWDMTKISNLVSATVGTQSSTNALGTLNVTKSVSIGGQAILLNTPNQILGAFDTTVQNEPVMVRGMTFYLRNSNDETPRNVMVVDQTGRVVAGPVTGVHTTVAGIPTITLTFSDTVTIPTGVTTYSLKGTVPASYSGQNLIIQTTPTSDWTGVNGSLDGLGIIPVAGTVTMNQSTLPGTQTSTIGTLSVAKSASMGSQVILMNTPNQILGAFDATVQNEPVLVPKMKFSISNNYSDEIRNIVLVDQGGRVLAGPVNSLITCVNNGNPCPYFFIFRDTVTIPTGVTTYYLKGTVPAGYAGQNLVIQTTPTSDWTGVVGSIYGLIIAPAAGTVRMDQSTVASM